MDQVLLASAYFPPIEFYHHYTKNEAIIIEQNEHFIKQTYRNRCSISGANGQIDLSIPLQKYTSKTLIRDIKISYEVQWQKQHWRSIVSAYNSSPYFMYYDYEIMPYFEKKNNYLFDLNLEILEKLNKLLKISKPFSLSEEFTAVNDSQSDLRYKISPKRKPEVLLKTYSQVFDQKLGFIENLSILDLLFNKGPDSMMHL